MRHDPGNATWIVRCARLSATNFVGDGSGLTNLSVSGDRIVSDTSRVIVNGVTGYVSITQDGAETGWFHPSRGLVALGVSTTGPISGTLGNFGRIDIVSSSHAQLVFRQTSLGTDEKQWKLYTEPGTPLFQGTVTNDLDTSVVFNPP